MIPLKSSTHEHKHHGTTSHARYVIERLVVCTYIFTQQRATDTDTQVDVSLHNTPRQSESERENAIFTRAAATNYLLSDLLNSWLTASDMA